MTEELDTDESAWMDSLDSQVTLTDESVITYISFSSGFAASGLVVFEDFAVCIRWFWSDASQAQAKPSRSEQPIPEWEQGFSALLERYLREGFKRDMEAELDGLIAQYCSGVSMGDLQVLPDDLEEILEDYGNPLVEEEDEENPQPPPAFDLHNPDHLAALQKHFERIAEI